MVPFLFYKVCLVLVALKNAPATKDTTQKIILKNPSLKL